MSEPLDSSASPLVLKCSTDDEEESSGTKSSSERHRKHRRKHGEGDRESRKSTDGERRRKDKTSEGGEERQKKRHRKPSSNTSSSGETASLSLSFDAATKKKSHRERREKKDSTSSEDASTPRHPRIVSSGDGTSSELRRHSSFGRSPNQSREGDVGLVSRGGSVSSGLVPRRRLVQSDPGTPKEPMTGGLGALVSGTAPIGISSGGRICADSVSARPQITYGRKTAEGNYNFEEKISRVPKIPPKFGSGEWRILKKEDVMQLPKSEPNSPVSPPFLETLSRRRNSDGTGGVVSSPVTSPSIKSKAESVGSPRHLGSLTELEVVDEDSNESADVEAQSVEGDKNRSKKRRISSCSSGAGKTLIIVKTTPPSQRRRGVSTSTGSSPSLILHLPLAESQKVLPSKVYFLGASGSGKSSMIQAMATGAFGVLDRYNKREKLVRVKLTRSRTDPMYVDVVDTTFPFEPYLKQPDPKCFVFVYSVTDAESMRFTEHLIHLFLSLFSSGNAPPCLVVGTKVDLMPEVPRAVPKEKGLAVAAGLRALHMEVSSRTLCNIASLKQLIYTTLQSPLSPKKTSRSKSVPRSSSSGSSRSSSAPSSPTTTSVSPFKRTASKNMSFSLSTSVSLSDSVSDTTTESVSDSVSDPTSEFKPTLKASNGGSQRISSAHLYRDSSESDSTSLLVTP
eukprot:TRINITY_DN4691_c0_g1_i1.p1 TRINITY_DN4691_c0_g1~~TRINITY_DN4691_c0_g1_i1.p1  ORF type:complete len:680 (-),score=97.66 TRINITY_DN4691_c0_g1_i1:196-2235(-)